MSQILERVQKVGRLEGREKRRLEEKHLVTKALLAAGDSMEKIMALTGLTRAEVEALKAH